MDVHARSIVGCAIDQRTAEILHQRLLVNHAGVLDWILGLGQPVRVVYVAGPAGFGLARALTAAGIGCLVAAPLRLQRPPGDRVKTNACDADDLARLDLLDQITPVMVPSFSREAARDPVRAREWHSGRTSDSHPQVGVRPSLRSLRVYVTDQPSKIHHEALRSYS